MLWALSGGAGFLGLHLARRLLDDGNDVRTLDVVPLDDRELEASVDELHGDVRDPAAVRPPAGGAPLGVDAPAAATRAPRRDCNRSRSGPQSWCSACWSCYEFRRWPSGITRRRIATRSST